ncbi:Protein FAM13A [Oopsacas minuta]|uniref:Protein FAM13A n=1 Tax=Oopsacas minuta TaxID=111878 RepID=A0AAV7K990_9METZ|nr:Protein FAM13A [Oopsacas minuta]
MSTNFLNQIRKSISSPKSKRKLSFQSSGTKDLLDRSASPFGVRVFGSTLPEVAKEYPTKNGVPFIVCRIAEYLTEHGLDQEGLFRKNGNIRVMDNLRYKFESDGDADLEAANDVFAAASLMKQFFRELREPLISDELIDQMIRVKQEFDFDSPGFIKQLHPILDELQLVNYITLKYVVQFLLRVSVHESSNKMSILSLAIVFGPSLFRSAPGMVGLKEQGIITPILIKFIQHSHGLFNRILTDSTTHRLLNTAQLLAAPDAKPSPPPKPKRKPYLFNTSPSSPASDTYSSPQITLNFRPMEDSPSLREVMSPWQCRLKSPVSPSPASSANFKQDLQMIIREAIDLYMWGDLSEEEEGLRGEEGGETPRTHKSDQRLSVKSLVSQFEDSSVVYGTAFRISDISNASTTTTLKHSTSNYDIHLLTRHGETATDEELYIPADNLEFLTLDRPRGPSSRKVPSREGRSRSASNDLSNSELDSFFGVDTTGNTTTSHLTQLSQLSTNTPNTSQPITDKSGYTQYASVETNKSSAHGKLVEELREVKREIRRFQLEFRQKNGRKPTLQEKECIRPVVMRYGEIKNQLGEGHDGTLETTMSPMSPRHVLKGSKGSQVYEINDTIASDSSETGWKYKIEMNTIANTLQEKRSQSARPSQIHAMSFEQLKQEKRDLQKALLVYEGKYGRPQGEAVIVMRPLYDRYRAIKQFLHKHPDGRLNPLKSGCASLQSLNSLHQTENTLSTIYASLGSVYPPETSTAVLLNSGNMDSYQIPQNASGISIQSNPSAASLISPEHKFPSPIQTTHTNSLKDFSLISSLHEYKEFLASESSLKPQDYWLSYHYIRARKKDLKQKLQDFEKEFKEKFDRKPNKVDRDPMLLDYKEYRLLKDKMSFLESNFNVNIRGQGGQGGQGGQLENELSP